MTNLDYNSYIHNQAVIQSVIYTNDWKLDLYLQAVTIIPGVIKYRIECQN